MQQPDPYSLPHKALRAAMAAAGTRLAAATPASAADDAAVVAAALDDLARHGAHEDEFVQPVLERFVPALAAEVAGQHAALTAAVDAVARHLDALRAEAEPEPGRIVAVYRALHRLAARNLAHLDHEEAVVLPALWLSAPAEAVGEVLARFRAAHPEAADLYRRWPDALNPAERALVGV